MGTSPGTAPFNSPLLLFLLERQRYAFCLSAVERVVRAVHVTPLPKSPACILGIINVQSRVLPVFDLRGRFQLASRPIELTDHLVLARTRRRRVALFADRVLGLLAAPPGAFLSADKILPRLAYLQGVVKLDDGLVLIHDLDSFLSLEEENELGSSWPSHFHATQE